MAGGEAGFVVLYSQWQQAVVFLEKYCSVVTEVWSFFSAFRLKAKRCSYQGSAGWWLNFFFYDKNES